ncbi:MAG: tetratricopeptide repeat protein [Myxococcaceae bacterium]
MARRFVCSVALLALVCGCGSKAADHISRARNNQFEKKPQAALAEYRLAVDALERDPSPEAAVYRARALKGAADVYDLDLRDYKRAVEVFRELIQDCPEAPESLDARIRLATILKEQFRDLRGAIKELTAALQRNPPQSAELRYEVAKLYFELGDYSQAEIESREVAKRYETSAFVDDALFLCGQSLSMEGKREESLKVLQELATRFPESEFYPHALFEMGKQYAEAGDDKRAIDVYVKALEKHPQPDAVQAAIARLRKRIISTTPEQVGRQEAFDHTENGEKVKAAAIAAQKNGEKGSAIGGGKTSVEAAGGSAEEAVKDYGD